MVLSTEWSQVEVIDLVNDGNGLGFMLVGGRSTGVVIKALIPGGIAERDGRLQCGDHVLQVCEVNLRGFNSEQVASVLRQSGHQVRLVVARPVEPTSPDYQALSSHAPIIPTKMLTDPDELDRTLLQTAGYADNQYIQSPDDDLQEEQEEIHVIPTNLPLIQTHIEVVAVNNAQNLASSTLTLISPSSMTRHQSQLISQFLMDSPENETYEVELRKNVYGLGITVAGYVCEEEELSGIFVKSIIEGSAAEVSGKIQINDRIVAVDGKSLSGVSNYQAVEILRNTDIAVNLTLERFLRGRKYEHLQVALVDGKDSSSMAHSPSITTLSLCHAKSDADSITTECGECGECDIDHDMESCDTQESNSVVENGDNGDHVENGSETPDLQTVEELKISPASTPTPTPSITSMAKSWRGELQDDHIVVAEVSKLCGLGISIEGTVEVEYGVEKRPHHFIRSILEEGPVGRDGRLHTGDELLQVNEHKLQGLKHTEVVRILKELPGHVKIVCARGSHPTVINTSQNEEAFEGRSILAGGLQSLLTKALSESSLYTSSTATITDQQRSKSVEQISGLALWTDEITFINIEKTDRGFGFSILDYQDPENPLGTVIIVRGLIPGGNAERVNLIFPGDRVVSVNDEDLRNCTLDHAVNILKSVPEGLARIGLCRPLSTSDNNLSSERSTPTT